MLFGTKKCQKCESEYDVASPTCPVCDAPDTRYEERKIPSSMTWLPWKKQIIIFLIGSLGLSLVATFVATFVTDEGFDLLITNFIAYLVAVLALVIFIGKDFLKLKPFFKQAYPYIVGGLGCLLLYLFTGFYGMVINSFHEMSVNANESTAETFINQWPVLAFLVIVLLGPICEELTYRLGLFSLLYRVKPWVAYLVSIILFGLIHFNVKSFDNKELLLNEFLNLPFYFFAGALFCFTYHKWGLAASLSAHLLNNLLTFLLVIARVQQ